MLLPRVSRGLAACILAASLVLVACGPTGRDVRVTALRDPARAGRTYWLVPAEGLGPDQLEYRAAESLVHKALRARGYQLVPRDTAPHLVILFGYGVGPGGVRSSERVSFSRRDWTRTEVFSVYTTWVRLTAVDGDAFAAHLSAKEVWTTTARTDARGSDLQVLLPVLLASAMDYFAASVPHDVRLLVPLDSERVEWLAGSGP